VSAFKKTTGVEFRIFIIDSSALFLVCKRIEELERNALPQDALDHLEAFEILSFMENNQNVLMIGNAGTWKSNVEIATSV
jgi:hypothetical protein